MRLSCCANCSNGRCREIVLKRGFIVLVFVLTACSSSQTVMSGAALSTLPIASWPMYQYSPSHNAVFSTPDLHARWVAELSGCVNGGLGIARSTVYYRRSN